MMHSQTQMPENCPDVQRIIDENGCMTVYQGTFVGCEAEYIAWHECLVKSDNLISPEPRCVANTRNNDCASEMEAANACG